LKSLKVCDKKATHKLLFSEGESSKLKKSIVCLLFSLCFIFISITSYVWAGDVYLAPDGTFVGGEPQLSPDGTFVGGEPQLAPDGTFVGGEPQLAPDGTFVGVESDW
jgi:hypothetical protein